MQNIKMYNFFSTASNSICLLQSQLSTEQRKRNTYLHDFYLAPDGGEDQRDGHHCRSEKIKTSASSGH